MRDRRRTRARLRLDWNGRKRQAPDGERRGQGAGSTRWERDASRTCGGQRGNATANPSRPQAEEWGITIANGWPIVSQNVRNASGNGIQT